MRFVAIVVALLSAPCVTEQSLQQGRLARELEVMSLTANAAMLIRNGKTEQAAEIRKLRRESNARDAPRRAAKYARENHQPDLAAPAEKIVKQLGMSPEK